MTGEKTQMGKIAASIQKPEEDTPLTKQLKKFSNQLTILVVLLATFVFFVGFLTGKEERSLFSPNQNRTGLLNTPRMSVEKGQSAF